MNRLENALGAQVVSRSTLPLSESAAMRPHPLEMARAVSAFQSMVAETPSGAGASTSRPHFRLPLKSAVDAAQLLYTSMAVGAAAAGMKLSRPDIERLQRFAPEVETFIQTLADTGTVDADSLALLRSAAPRAPCALTFSMTIDLLTGEWSERRWKWRRP